MTIPTLYGPFPFALNLMCMRYLSSFNSMSPLTFLSPFVSFNVITAVSLITLAIVISFSIMAFFFGSPVRTPPHKTEKLSNLSEPSTTFFALFSFKPPCHLHIGLKPYDTPLFFLIFVPPKLAPVFPPTSPSSSPPQPTLIFVYLVVSAFLI